VTPQTLVLSSSRLPQTLFEFVFPKDFEMEESSTGESPLASSPAQPNIRTRIVRIEHAVTTSACPELAWRVFTDWKHWPRISNRYHGIQWSGIPWSSGSRLRVHLLKPFKATVDRVITSCEPSQSLAWINHVKGYTMEQWLFFHPLAEGTRVFTWLDFTGPSEVIEGRSVREIIGEYLQEWYEAFRLQCDRASASS